MFTIAGDPDALAWIRVRDAERACSTSAARSPGPRPTPSPSSHSTSCPTLIALAHRVRLAWCGAEVELESLINAKSGACPEDCAFCSQSVRFDTDVDVYPFLDLDEVLAAARATRAAGATQFCIVVAVRGPRSGCSTR